jgi:F420-non-reducing hydrogenase iron-sulfur subunit
MRLVYKLVEDMGIGKERVHHDWISASEGEKFKTTMEEFHKTLSKLGPLELE